MDQVHGISLEDWLNRHGPMPLEQFVPLFERVYEVVHAAHERGIVHRDLKPSNIMVGRLGRGPPLAVRLRAEGGHLESSAIRPRAGSRVAW